MEPESSSLDEIRRFEEQYRSQPDSLVFARLADAYRKAGDHDMALGVLAEGLERHPDYPSGHIVRARTLRDLGQLDEAAQAFRTVLELDGENLVAVRELGSLAEDRGELLEARHWTERLVEVDPTNSEAAQRLTELERALAASGESRPSEDAAREPVAPVTSETEHESSKWWNDPVEPVPSETLDRPIDDESSPVVVDEVEDAGIPLEGDEVVAAILNGDVPRTIRAEDTWWYEERQQESPPEPSADADLLTRTMADLYAEQGLFDQAAEIYEELLRDAPDDAELRARLAELHEKTGAGDTDVGIDVLEADPSEWAAAGADTTIEEGGPGDRQPEDSMLEWIPVEEPGPVGPPVGDELRRILRLGERAAAALPEPMPLERSADVGIEPAAESVAQTEDAETAQERSSESEFTRRWLSDLQDSG